MDVVTVNEQHLPPVFRTELACDTVIPPEFQWEPVFTVGKPALTVDKLVLAVDKPDPAVSKLTVCKPVYTVDKLEPLSRHRLSTPLLGAVKQWAPHTARCTYTVQHASVSTAEWLRALHVSATAQLADSLHAPLVQDTVQPLLTGELTVESTGTPTVEPAAPRKTPAKRHTKRRSTRERCVVRRPGWFFCSQCTYASNNEANVRRHTNAKHETLFICQCPHCGRCSRQSSNMKLHAMQFHNSVLEFAENAKRYTVIAAAVERTVKVGRSRNQRQKLKREDLQLIASCFDFTSKT